MTFREAMELTRTISSSTAFEDSECEAYWELLMSLRKGSVIVEIGLEYGRSSSLALQATRQNTLEYHGIDPFDDPTVAMKWLEMALKTRALMTVHFMESAFAKLPQMIDFALIDGDHSELGVATDCRIILPKIVCGGRVCFHDYGRHSFPEVYKTVQAYMAKLKPAWIELPTVGTLGIWRRIM